MATDKNESKKRKRDADEAESPKKKVKKDKTESPKKKDKKDKKEKKEKKEKKAEKADNEPHKEERAALGTNYEHQVKRVSVIANPMAPKSLNMRLLKSVKGSAEGKTLRRGVKEVVKAIRKKETGFVLIAGDINPIDVITHVPVLCEEASIPYIFVPSKEELGLAGLTKRPTSVVMVRDNSKDKEGFQSCVKDIKAIPVPASVA